jgi:hypothetical protein
LTVKFNPPLLCGEGVVTVGVVAVSTALVSVVEGGGVVEGVGVIVLGGVLTMGVIEGVEVVAAGRCVTVRGGVFTATCLLGVGLTAGVLDGCGVVTVARGVVVVAVVEGTVAGCCCCALLFWRLCRVLARVVGVGGGAISVLVAAIVVWPPVAVLATVAGLPVIRRGCGEVVGGLFRAVVVTGDGVVLG